jgi:glycosyltransferase involved in cell wall biosynthesis
MYLIFRELIVLRVLMVNTGFLPVPPIKGGSVELHTYYLSNELAKLGAEIHYVTSINPGATFNNKVILHKLPWIPFNFHGSYVKTTLSFCVGGFLAFLKAIKALTEDKYDIVHVHGHLSGFLLSPLRSKSIFVFTAHNPNPWMVQSFSKFKQAYRVWAFKKIELKIAKAVDCLITVSEQLKNEFVTRFNICPKKIKVIPNGVDANFFRPNIENSEDVLLKYHLPEEYILFVGRLVEQKGIQFLLRALKGTDINLVIVGGGPLFSYLRKLCEHLKITDQVYFIGSVPIYDLRKIYSRASFLVFPSVAEGFPLVILEAMASGLPIVASSIKGVDSIVHNGYNGFLFEMNNVEDLHSKIIRLYGNKSLSKAMGVRSRKIVENEFSWTVVAKKTFQLYTDLLNNKSSENLDGLC